MDDQWRIAEDALHNMWAAVDEVHPALKGGTCARPPRNANHRRDVGPGVAFGQQLHDLTGITIGLLLILRSFSLATLTSAAGKLVASRLTNRFVFAGDV